VPLISDRWKIEKVLGTGGFGVVYSAFDLERSERVALKSLKHFEPAALARLKDEFRALRDFVHPNLVSLFEFVHDEETAFFTMELVDGIDLLAYLRPGVSVARGSSKVSEHGPISASRLDTFWAEAGEHEAVRGKVTAERPVDAGRVMPVFRQLAEGIAAIHQAGKLHCDIKPSNVLIERNGRVVVLDFGLVTDVTTSRTQRGIAGTVPYMSPEQAASRKLDEASDWYSFGVVLYEALTGRLPFDGPLVEVLTQKQTRDPIPAGKLVAEIPSDLESLCTRLLSREPRERPNRNEILQVMGGRPVEVDVPASVEPPLILGRERELQWLRDALDRVHSGRMVTLYVHGESGVGKSLLVQRFLQEAKERDALILQGRCYERESVPYKALDGVMDDLARQLRRFLHRRAGVVKTIPPDSLAALARQFPALAGVAQRMGAPDRLEGPDPQELRRRAAAALRQLLRNLSLGGPVVLFVDDLQWGDLDSVALLQDLMREGAETKVLVILCFRSEDRDRTPCLLALPEAGKVQEDIRELRVGGLDPDDAARLWRVLARTSALEFEEVALRDTQGNPFLLQQLARYSALPAGPEAPEKISFQEILRRRLTGLPEDSVRLLTIIAMAGQPISERAAAVAAELSSQPRAAVSVLRSESLIRTGGEQSDRLVVFHDRIREAVVAPLDGESRRVGHAKIAAALEKTGEAAPETLAHHHDVAENFERAAMYAARAARRASEALAFDNAAQLYQRAITLRSRCRPASEERDKLSEPGELQLGLARSLANAGRGYEAADAFLAACEHVEPELRLGLQQHAADQLLHAGHVDRGLDILKSVLISVGLSLPKARRIPLDLLYWRLRNRLRGLRWRERPAVDVPSGTLLRIDACSSAATGLALVDIARGAAIQSANLALSLQAGEPHRVARALAMEAAYRSTTAGRGRTDAARLIRIATELSEKRENPRGVGLSRVMAAGCAWNAGRWVECRHEAQRGRDILEAQCQGVTWERDTANIFEVDSLRWMGRWAEMKKLLPPLIADAQSRGDLYAETILQMHCGSCAELANDDPAGALRGLELLKRWSNTGFHVEHLIEAHNQVEIALYQQDGQRAWTLINERWPSLRRSLLLRVQTFRIQMLSIRARAALSATTASESRRESLLKSAIRDSDAILRERTPWCLPVGRLIQGCVETVNHRHSEAVNLLATAEREALAVDMMLHAAAAQRFRGLLLGGAGGRDLVSQADQAIRAETVVNPARLCAVMVPAIGPFQS
jgi:serine/threonine protein kinase